MANSKETKAKKTRKTKTSIQMEVISDPIATATADNNDVNDVNNDDVANVIDDNKGEMINMTNTNNEMNTSTNTNINANDNASNSKGEIEMMNTNNNNATVASGNNYIVSGISQEKLAEILRNAGVDPSAIQIAPKKTKVVDKLEHDGDFAVDKTGQRFEFSSLSEEEKAESMKTGLSPANLMILAQAKQIKEKSGFRTRVITDNRPSEDKPGFRIREIVKANLDTIDEKTLKSLQDKDFCKKQFKLQYPLLLNITNLSPEEIAIARKDAKGRSRFAPQQYKKDNEIYLMTNDLYSKNLPLINAFFSK